MATQLAIYNDALRHCGERTLASLVENREPRRLLDSIWNGGDGHDFIKYCLEQGYWKFASRTSKLTADPGIAPSFGFQNGFEKPTDWVRLAEISTDEYFSSNLLQYTDETGYLFADDEEIYVRYISDDTAYGRDLTLWPMSFTYYVGAQLGSMACLRLTQDSDKETKLFKLADLKLTQARSNDALAGPTKFMPTGTWVNSRRGGSGSDRGNRGRLIG